MEIITHPNPVLKQRAADVDDFGTPELKNLIVTLTAEMYRAPGIGIAATQIGVMKRVFVYDIDDGPVALCNPTIVSFSEETELVEEGCLSLPGVEIPIPRAVSLACEAFDMDGNPVRIEASDLLARVLQHEIDHLDGVLIIDRASAHDRRDAIKRYNELVGGVR